MSEFAKYRPEFVKEILEADAAPPEGTISDISELISPQEEYDMTNESFMKRIHCEHRTVTMTESHIMCANCGLRWKRR